MALPVARLPLRKRHAASSSLRRGAAGREQAGGAHPEQRDRRGFRESMPANRCVSGALVVTAPPPLDDPPLLLRLLPKLRSCPDCRSRCFVG